MDNFAALEILASINKLTSQIADLPKSSNSGFWQPWMGTIVGVVIGFSLNYLKDYISQFSDVKNKTNSIRFEVEDIKDNAAYGLKCMIEYYDHFYKNPNKRLDVKLPTEVARSCFDKYYHEVVLPMTKEQRNSLVKTYVHSSYAGELKRKFIKEISEGGVSIRNKNNQIDSMIYSYLHVYHSAKSFLEDLPDTLFRPIDIFNELNLDSDYISLINSLSDSIQSEK